MSRAIDHYRALSPRDYPYLERLAIVEEAGALGPEIALEMRFYGADGKRLLVRCSGVRDLEFKQPWTTDMKLHSLKIADLASAQMEDIRLAVRDLEEEFLSFECRTFEAERHA